MASLVTNQYNDEWFKNNPDCHRIDSKEEIKDGRKYTSLSYLRDLTPWERIARLVAAVFLTVFTAVIGLLLFEGLRNLWIELYNGQERVDVEMDKPGVEVDKDEKQVNDPNGLEFDLESDNDNSVWTAPKVPDNQGTDNQGTEEDLKTPSDKTGWESEEDINTLSSPTDKNGMRFSPPNSASSDNPSASVIDPLVKVIDFLMDTFDYQNLKIFSESNEQREAIVLDIISDIQRPILPGQKSSLKYRRLPKLIWICYLQNENEKFNNMFKIIQKENIFSLLFDFLNELKADVDKFTKGDIATLDQSKEAVITFNQRVVAFKASISEFIGAVAIKCKMYNVDFSMFSQDYILPKVD